MGRVRPAPEIATYPSSICDHIFEDNDRRVDYAGGVDYPITSIHRAIENYGIDIDPPYQRDRVWTQQQRQEFVGYLLSGGEVLPCTINQGPRGDYPRAELVDGKQRVTACLRWVEGEPALMPSGLYLPYDGLSPIGRRKAGNRANLRFRIVHMTTPQVLELYLRINTTGVAHTQAELDRVRTLLAEANGANQ